MAEAEENTSIRDTVDSLHQLERKLRLKRLDLWNQQSITKEQYWDMRDVENKLADSADELALQDIQTDLDELQEASSKIQATTEKLNAAIAQLKATDHFLSNLSNLIEIGAQIVSAGACGDVPGIALQLDNFLNAL